MKTFTKLIYNISLGKIEICSLNECFMQILSVSLKSRPHEPVCGLWETNDENLKMHIVCQFLRKFCLKNYKHFFSKSNCGTQGQKFEKVIDNSILPVLGPFFCKKVFFVAPTKEALGGVGLFAFSLVIHSAQHCNF